MFDRPVVVIDTETTSLDPYNRVIWEIGMVKITPEGGTDSRDFQVELTQREIDNADPVSLEIGGFDERYNAYSALSRRTVANYVHDYTDGCYVAGICVDFDVRTLTDLLHSHGLQAPWAYHVLDVRTLAVGYLRGKGSSIPFPSTQDNVATELGIDVISEAARHTALGDAEYGAAMLLAVMNQE